MKKKWGVLSLVFVITLTGCIPGLERAEEDVIIVEETEEEDVTEYIITPTIESPDHFYRNVLVDGTYQRSEARGTTAHAMNNRIDIDQFELGLMEIASSVYEQEGYYFQEGSHLSGELINSWLRRYDEDDNPAGLNPAPGSGDSEEKRLADKPLIISHIMEHNYYTGNDESGVNLSGVVIGISLRSVYYFRTEDEDGGYYFHEKEVDPNDALEHGEEAAQKILERLREMEGLEDVPVTIALYNEEARGSIVPGTFVAMAQAGSGDDSLGNWEAINEEFITFPSSQAREVQPGLSDNFTKFRQDIETFFDTNVGVVGKGRYKNDTLQELKIEINLQSHGKAEIVALTQFLSGKVENTFGNNAPVYIYVESVNGAEALIVQIPEQEPYMHVYR
ncbi:CamS family sex pheromone protein [Salipaludibacillus agaradhaerens]|uniref:CamS family sex pheromone protein n=1 Tax=Salipaludibacillus agaradhaerens TaxID=76935 RepID=A0A9Q4B3C5_SALAG|nr:CamS family sex pheromone protein [Salipaludibacillus agaradhaerens]MCR6097569.1 CamS family sex pheromone protein [Salipaludibacillus agaradhaerens]MCR6112947.1 CamS family sex pheromone protein [Salipaludibacillus agaradhaerens]